MNFVVEIVAWTLALFVGMLVCVEVGRRIGLARLRANPDGLAKGAGAAEGAVFGLLGLLIAFTFSNAGQRYEHRKALIVQEANAIGTAFLRLDLLPAEGKAQLVPLFKEYTEIRARVYEDADDKAETSRRIGRTSQLQDSIWRTAVRWLRADTRSPAPTQLVLTALNDMIDITATRQVARESHTPAIAFLLLSCLSLASALLVGYSLAKNQRRTWLHMVIFSAVLSVTVFVIVDLEYPRLGTIRIDDTDHFLLDLRASMDGPPH